MSGLATSSRRTLSGGAAEWEDRLRSWSKPMDEKQEAKAKRTAEEVEAALDRYQLLPNSTFRTFPQGSKYNNTDVPGDSDVDIGVEALVGVTSRTAAKNATFFPERTSRTASVSDATLGFTSRSPMPTKEFKNRVHDALVDHFGSSFVERGDKCIKVRSSRITLPADVVPCFPVRRFVAPSPSSYFEGVRLFPDSGGSIDNYPHQHHRNGVDKNTETGRRYKKMVRCLKRLENELLADGRLDNPVPSFLMECLVFSSPNAYFADDSYLETFKSVVLFGWGATRDEGAWRNWLEVNEIKPLFRAVGGTFDRAQANELLWNAYRVLP